ncbi:type IV pilus assembly protein PilM [Sanguibacter massiliensis]|uniref:type IV pilus assembly protein PilM n=1 Tax=Sanguibacter massiliensis TaxID=1973217 RepID=UPI000C867040|nr:type IV pilus assembly protein PilM [Sanguibacter massiliensis]
MARERVVGLDIGTVGVRAVEMELAGPGRGGTIHRIGEVPLPPGVVRDAEVIEKGPVSAAIKKLWSSDGMSAKRVVMGVGNQRVVVRNMTMPRMPIGQLRQAAVYQAQETLPMSVDEALTDFLPTHEFVDGNGDSVAGLFVAAGKDTVSLNVLAVESAGVSPAVVDLNAFALMRAASLEHGGATIACVDIGARVTNVVISHEGRPQLVRVIAAGGQDATDGLARVLKTTDAEAENLKRQMGLSSSVPAGLEEAARTIQVSVRNIVDPVVSTLSYYGSQIRGPQISMLVLTGGGAQLPGLGQYLASAARLPATLGSPFSGVQWTKSAGRERFADRESSFAVAVGLALGGAA